jgi:hypothetical protein
MAAAAIAAGSGGVNSAQAPAAAEQREDGEARVFRGFTQIRKRIHPQMTQMTQISLL